MNQEFFNALALLESEQGIPMEYMIPKIEAALTKACQKEIGPSTIIRVQIDPVKQDMKVFQQRSVVPDGTVEDPLTEISVTDAKAISRRHIVTSQI